MRDILKIYDDGTATLTENLPRGLDIKISGQPVAQEIELHPDDVERVKDLVTDETVVFDTTNGTITSEEL